MGNGAGAALRWTGHALVDVGVAGLCAFAGRKTPEELTLEDLDAASDFMVSAYYGGALGTYLSCVFMNASFVQPAEGEAKKTAFIEQYVRAHRAAPQAKVADLRCAFSGAPATSAMVRTHLPLFSGEDVMNFRPNGETFVPVAGPFVVAIMFLPMASRRSEGRLLAVHADDPPLTLRFARRYIEDNRRLLQLALPTTRSPTHAGYDREQPSWDAGKKRYKFADAKGPRSLVVHDLTTIAAEAMPNDVRPHPTAVTAYLLSNSGQGPSLEIFQIPSGVVAFVAQASAAPTAAAWKAVSSRFWPVSGQDESAGEDSGASKKPARKKKGDAPIPGRAGWTRNPAFEDLVAVYDGGFLDRGAAARWLKRYVLGRSDRQEGSAYADSGARSWLLAGLFLREVLGMKEGRIKAIRAFADKLADWIHRKTDKRLYRGLLFAPHREVRGALLRAHQQSAKEQLLFGLDEFRDVWLHDDGDQYLVRDLICIRVVERLYELGYFKQHPDEVPEAERPSEEEETTEEARA